VRERLGDLVRLELVADVEKAIRGQTNMPIRQAVVLVTKTPGANRAKRLHWSLATSAFAELWDVVHIAPLR
jgi:putative SOS response-associated peptidase YedK